MIARIISSTLIALWALLFLMGKGGFVHLLLLSGICIGTVELTAVYRSTLKVATAHDR